MAKAVMHSVAGNFAEEVVLHSANFKFVAIKPVSTINYNDIIINVHCVLRQSIKQLHLHPVNEGIKRRKKNFLFPGTRLFVLQ